MSASVVLDNEYITVWYHPEKKIVHHKFHKFIHGQAFRDGLNAGVELMKKHKAQKWLSDDRANSALPPEDVEWAKGDWFPRTLAAGWKYWALVQPEKVIGQINMQNFTEPYAKQGVTVRLFSDPDAALAWLESI